jgi:uncharacterized membrane protein
LLKGLEAFHLTSLIIIKKGASMAENSTTENRILMQQARESLKGKWGLAVGTCLVYMLIVCGISSIPRAGTLLSFLISGPMMVGLAIFSLAVSRDRNPQFEQIFHGFKNFGVSLGAYLLYMIFVILWALLLIVPGIIAAISYSMTYFIIADDDSTGPLEAIRKSKKMMYGYKWKYFCLCLRFLGWLLLCILTLGIGFLWLVPYGSVSFAKFYEDLSHTKAEQVKTDEPSFGFEQ